MKWGFHVMRQVMWHNTLTGSPSHRRSPKGSRMDDRGTSANVDGGGAEEGRGSDLTSQRHSGTFSDAMISAALSLTPASVVRIPLFQSRSPAGLNGPTWTHGPGFGQTH